MKINTDLIPFNYMKDVYSQGTSKDLNTYDQPGIYGIYGNHTNAPTIRINDASYQILTVKNYSDSHIVQILHTNAGANDVPQIYMRMTSTPNSIRTGGTGYQVPLLKAQYDNGWYRQKDVHANLFYAETSHNYLILKTPIALGTNSMPRIKIEGYHYAGAAPFECQVAGYEYQGGTINAGGYGNYIEEVKICRDSTSNRYVLQFKFPDRLYFFRFVVSEYYDPTAPNAARGTGEGQSGAADTELDLPKVTATKKS